MFSLLCSPQEQAGEDKVTSGPPKLERRKSRGDGGQLEDFFSFWPCPTACGILVPRPGIEPVPPAVEARSLNHWTAREVPS